MRANITPTHLVLQSHPEAITMLPPPFTISSSLTADFGLLLGVLSTHRDIKRAVCSLCVMTCHIFCQSIIFLSLTRVLITPPNVRTKEQHERATAKLLKRIFLRRKLWLWQSIKLPSQQTLTIRAGANDGGVYACRCVEINLNAVINFVPSFTVAPFFSHSGIIARALIIVVEAGEIP